MRISVPSIVCAALLFSTGALGDGDAAQRIDLTLTGIKANQGGTLIVGLYRGKDGWLEIENASMSARVAVKAETQTVTFENVELDPSYAIAVIHDKNENGKMDLRKFPFPKPKEGVGVSNNRIGLGPPSYRKAEFEVGTDAVSLTIEMNY